MCNRLPCALALTALLAGCSSFTRHAVIDTQLSVCPAVAPEAFCRDTWPDPSSPSLRDLLIVTEERKVTWQACMLAVDAWQAAYDYCVKETTK